MSGHSIFITGGGGKIGRILIPRLVEKGYTLKLLSRKEGTVPHVPGITYVYGDIADPFSYTDALSDVNTVIHMAAVTHTNDISMYYRINTDATLELARASSDAGVKRFIFLSSRTASLEGGHYSISKIRAEEHVAANAPGWVVLKLAEVYGMSSSTGVDRILEYAEKSPLIPVAGHGGYTLAPVHIDDVVTAVMAVLENRDISGRSYIIAGPGNMTYNELVDTVLAALGKTAKKVHIPLGLLNVTALLLSVLLKDPFLVKDQIPRLLCEKPYDISAAKKDLGFSPGGILEMLRARPYRSGSTRSPGP